MSIEMSNPLSTNNITHIIWHVQVLFIYRIKPWKLERKKKKIVYLRNSKSIKNYKEVAEKIRESGLIGLGRRVGKTVASVIGRDGSESGMGEGDHLVAPRVPYLWEPVQEYDDVWTWNPRKRRVVSLTLINWWSCITNGMHVRTLELPVPISAMWSLRAPTLTNVCWIWSMGQSELVLCLKWTQLNSTVYSPLPVLLCWCPYIR